MEIAMVELAGVIVPLVTPLNEDGSLDEEGLENLLDRLLSNGVHGVFIGGTTGEFLALPTKIRYQLFSCTVREIGNNAVTVAGIGSTCMEEVLKYADEAAKAGANCVSLVPPSFFPMSEDQVYSFYSSVVEKTPLPLVLYNHPDFARNRITVNVVNAFVSDERVIGIKDSSGDLDYFDEILRLSRGTDFRVLMGNESLMAEGIRRGAHGCVPSLGNLYPRLFVDCYNAALEGNWATAASLQEDIIRLLAPIAKNGQWTDMLRRLKAKLAEQGICQSHMARTFSAQHHLLDREKLGAGN